MTIPELPWWPPTSADDLTEDHVRHLFRSLKPRTPSIMAEGERRIREVVGPDAPITVHHPTIRSLAGRRLGQLDVLSVISLRAGRPLERQARFLIGVSLDREGAIMVTPNLNPATHLVWERWAMWRSPNDQTTTSPSPRSDDQGMQGYWESTTAWGEG